jgi:hypothetical protein
MIGEPKEKLAVLLRQHGYDRKIPLFRNHSETRSGSPIQCCSNNRSIHGRTRGRAPPIKQPIAHSQARDECADRLGAKKLKDVAKRRSSRKIP